MAEASARRRIGRLAKAIVFSGTKIRPRPAPWKNPVITNGWAPCTGENRLMPHKAAPVIVKPAASINRGSIPRPTSCPAAIIAIIMPIPRGIISAPADTTG